MEHRRRTLLPNSPNATGAKSGPTQSNHFVAKKKRRIIRALVACEGCRRRRTAVGNDIMDSPIGSLQQFHLTLDMVVRWWTAHLFQMRRIWSEMLVFECEPQ
jgi:hypothetical protein